VAAAADASPTHAGASVPAVPLGVPFERSASGTASKAAPAKHDFELAGACPARSARP
jgi:hypothetical protein